MDRKLSKLSKLSKLRSSTAFTTVRTYTVPNKSFRLHANYVYLLCVHNACVNQMATNVEQNKIYYVYFEIFNQITHTRWAFHYEWNFFPPATRWTVYIYTSYWSPLHELSPQTYLWLYLWLQQYFNMEILEHLRKCWR